MEADAIVNAAKSTLMGGGGVDGTIHRDGVPAILEECKHIVAERGHLPTGQAVITTGGNLLADCVIHTVGPVWNGGHHDEPRLLASAYRECLKLAMSHGLRTVSFPSINIGAYDYPIHEAARVALGEVLSFLAEKPPLKEVAFLLFDTPTLQAYRGALEELHPRGMAG